MNMQLRPDSGAEFYLRARVPEHPVLFFCPDALRRVHARFVAGFPGLVTYAVKANPGPEVLRVLVGAGMRAFDVASLAEIAAVQAICPEAVLHYNNPVRSRKEIAGAVAAGVRSFSVDRVGELDKLVALCPTGSEVSVRFKLPVAGAAYDFGAKFGARPEQAVELMQRAARAGFTVSLSFHPGTQCADPKPWVSYIAAAAQIAAEAGVAPARLNVGGGMPSHRGGLAPELDPFFKAISGAVAEAFVQPPALLCEPGRGMVADSMALALRVKARDGHVLFLNDGRYGTLTEFADIGAVERVWVPGRSGDPVPFTVFGPTCDSLDMLPAPLMLPGNLDEGDYLVFEGMGAYSSVLATPFNGYGTVETVVLG